MSRLIFTSTTILGVTIACRFIVPQVLASVSLLHSSWLQDGILFSKTLMKALDIV